jgi:mRNA-degrading endonuclease RelE of RelBE toxin-antitoxin system
MEVNVTTHATRQLKKLLPAARLEVQAAIDSLEYWPNVEKVKRLADRNDYRLRVGQYRVFFVVAGSVIGVTQVLARNERTYKKRVKP